MIRAAALGAAIVMGVAGDGAAQSFTGVQWDHRPLLVFAPEGSAAVARQEASLASDPDLRRDLKLAVYVVGPKAVSPRFGAPAVSAEAGALRGRFGVEPGEVRVVLVGLDGGAKLSAAEPIPLDALEATINRMPMRRRELRERD